MSNSVQLAKDLAAFLNITEYEWVSPVLGATQVEGAHSLAAYGIEAQAFVIPVIKRANINQVRVFISPPPNSRIPLPNRDRCGRRWTRVVDIAVVQRIDENDTKIEQPMTLDSIDALMGFTDSITDFLDDNKSFGKNTLTDIQQVSYDEKMLRDEHIFLATVAPTYLTE